MGGAREARFVDRVDASVSTPFTVCDALMELSVPQLVGVVTFTYVMDWLNVPLCSRNAARCCMASVMYFSTAARTDCCESIPVVFYLFCVSHTVSLCGLVYDPQEEERRMSDLSPFMFPAEHPILCNIGAVLCTSLAAYIGGIMMRRLWHQRQLRVACIAVAVVRRELCREYVVMLNRLPTLHCFDRDMKYNTESDVHADDTNQINLFAQRTTQGGTVHYAFPDTPVTSKRNSVLYQTSTGITSNSCNNSPLTNQCNSSGWVQADIDPFDRISILCNVNHTPQQDNTEVSRPSPRWRDTLIYNISNFIEFKQMPFLSDAEQQDIMARCVRIMGKRIMCVNSDHTRQVQSGLARTQTRSVPTGVRAILSRDDQSHSM